VARARAMLRKDSGVAGDDSMDEGHDGDGNSQEGPSCRVAPCNDLADTNDGTISTQ
jgi:hypothetical protein